MDFEEFRHRCDVSRETFAALEHYVALIEKWNPRINLIGRSTLSDVWSRHILDSAQLHALGQGARRWADLGSGGGLPGIVLAILDPQAHYTLVESDVRKSAFLMTAARELSLPVDVVAQRIEGLPPLGVDHISARALAPLADLFVHVERHGAPGCVALFPKGAQVDAEIAVALEGWRFDCQKVPSATAPDSFVLKIGDLRRA